MWVAAAAANSLAMVACSQKMSSMSWRLNGNNDVTAMRLESDHALAA